jgi:hypothetical protein
MDSVSRSRFWAKVQKTGYCWIWKGARNKRGYGRYTFPDGKTAYAHRIAFEEYFWPLSPGECVMHDCDNPSCVRPAHLTPGDRAENNADMGERGRARGPRELLRAVDVLMERGPLHYKELAKQADVSEMTAKRARKAMGFSRPWLKAQVEQRSKPQDNE